MNNTLLTEISLFLFPKFTTAKNTAVGITKLATHKPLFFLHQSSKITRFFRFQAQQLICIYSCTCSMSTLLTKSVVRMSSMVTFTHVVFNTSKPVRICDSVLRPRNASKFIIVKFLVYFCAAVKTAGVSGGYAVEISVSCRIMFRCSVIGVEFERMWQVRGQDGVRGKRNEVSSYLIKVKRQIQRCYKMNYPSD